MSAVGSNQFDAILHKTNEWLRDVMQELDWDDRHRAYHALRAVLHTLRDRLSLEEAVDLAAQLPVLIRGMYYEGWQPNKVPVRDRSALQFIEHIQAAYPEETSEEVERITHAVFRVVSKHVTAGEIRDICACLPEQLRELWS